jgi:hypothetical protein
MQEVADAIAQAQGAGHLQWVPEMTNDQLMSATMIPVAPAPGSTTPSPLTAYVDGSTVYVRDLTDPSAPVWKAFQTTEAGGTAQPNLQTPDELRHVVEDASGWAEKTPVVAGEEPTPEMLSKAQQVELPSSGLQGEASTAYILDDKIYLKNTHDMAPPTWEVLPRKADPEAEQAVADNVKTGTPSLMVTPPTPDEIWQGVKVTTAESLPVGATAAYVYDDKILVVTPKGTSGAIWHSYPRAAAAAPPADAAAQEDAVEPPATDTPATEAPATDTAAAEAAQQP